MINISKKSQYGLRAMIFLARHYKDRRLYSIKTISEKEGLPFNFLEKILLSLEKKGLVKGKKGAGGGYRLSLPPQKISFWEIVTALEGKKEIVNCRFCNRLNQCRAKNAWRKLDIAIKNTLKSITLFQLIK